MPSCSSIKKCWRWTPDGLPASSVRRVPSALPVVLTRDEVPRVLAELTGTYRLIGQLLYGAGLRLLECLCLRVQDLDFGRRQILVRHGKGGKDRWTMLPDAIRPDLQAHLAKLRVFP